MNLSFEGKIQYESSRIEANALRAALGFTKIQYESMKHGKRLNDKKE
ncbi:MAG: hypothetical protein ACPGGA_11855 [Balneolaceae bacterium]